MKHVLSLGAGVQSSTLALMAENELVTYNGEVVIPEFAVFADTQDEPAEVYEWLDWLETELSFPIYRTTRGKLSDAVTNLKTAKAGHLYTATSIPVFTLGENGKKGITQRQCTSEFKVRQIRKELRKRIKIAGGVKICQWLGISTDEAHRMKDSQVRYIVNHYPLIDMNISRQDCLNWMELWGYPRPPRSACYYCPFHSDAQWKALSEFDMQRAIEFEKEVQDAYVQADNVYTVPYLHQKRIPLGEVNFGESEGMGNECEGMCGI